MEKIKKYNQILLATFGTLAVIGATILIIIALSEMFSRHEGHNYINQNDLIVNNAVDSTDSIVKTPELTFSLPILLDTIPEIYIIPVSQINSLIKNTYEESTYSRISSKKKYYRRNGNFNNLIIFDGINNEKKLIFDRKINITSYQYYKFNNSSYIFIIGGTKDTNNDNKLNNSDLKSFYAYNLTDKTLKEYEIEGFNLVSYDILNDKNDIILEYGSDKNLDGEFNQYLEPNILKQLSLSTMILDDFISTDLNSKIQSNIK